MEKHDVIRVLREEIHFLLIEAQEEQNKHNTKLKGFISGLEAAYDMLIKDDEDAMHKCLNQYISILFPKM